MVIEPLAAISPPAAGLVETSVGATTVASSSPPQPIIIKTIKAAVNRAEILNTFFISVTPYPRAFVSSHSKPLKNNSTKL
jgi:hypothetical protein